MIGHYTLKPQYINNPNLLIQELQKYDGLPVDWNICKRAEALGLVEIMNVCLLRYQFPYAILVQHNRKMVKGGDIHGKKSKSKTNGS